MPNKHEFDHVRRKWDHYGMFHNTYGSVVHFETGELIVTKAKHHPHERRGPDINRFNIRFVHARDNVVNQYNLYTPNGERVLKSWLDGYLLFDFERMQVVQLGYINHSTKNCPDSPIPPHIAKYQFAAYCPGAGRKWVGGVQLGYDKPKKLAPDEKKHIRELITACRAADRLKLLPMNLLEVPYNERGTEGFQYGAGGKVVVDTILHRSFETMTPFEKAVIARNGYEPPRETLYVDELVIEEK